MPLRAVRVNHWHVPIFLPYPHQLIYACNTMQIIYEHATVGESMIAYVELVNDCDALGVFRIGEPFGE